ncbi:helix-turn-helix transcriptional regulator [Bariatricus massiliensis]|uniref:Helix-turn-helix transcriptional regulator n=1 Tax=Bariatricus massiliensis TaxID=1745713 RepID=A0ABS8DKW9_9FIRM|nr:helix-turn-helix transcriptional regulator [Bariatricus massiliensis]MCB7305950.1 helix-turn-helix transcriptional regulator [Bariatricus massiliensis]MCB7376460.1 helix-turn-helix transcriptional regulator [Bariatricus massiliensis]MCB7389093.1 helix-turn-helix transcriptional regulator [Bariatricus massiliensis]MCB7413266.1 helix-turn-helix transcriptional regulator [Bariatricus massiliensis]MCQ5255163.1 helix-turn-helix transcriptional regulator [Bariatricus massiliensis]
MRNQRMRMARLRLDMSQEDLALQVDVTRQTIGMIETGKFNPSLRLCIAICRALEVTLNDIFWEEDEDEKSCR